MSQYFYDGQMRRYLTQFIRVMSNFSYKDAKGNLVQVPVRYGDMSRQVAGIMKQNSENFLNSAPFISCYIKDVQFDRERMQDPTFVSKVQVRERDFEGYYPADYPEVTLRNTPRYLNTQGSNYTVERLMPVPYKVTFSADLWTTNTEQKLQLWEQIVVLFNPSLEMQTTDNFLDWTSLTLLELATMQFESRTVPQGIDSDISVCALGFTSPIWITPPAKVKKLGIITKIISNVFEVPQGSVASGDYLLSDLYAGEVVRDKVVVTPSGYDVMILNNVATLLPIKMSASDTNPTKASWSKILDLYPGKFQAGISQLRLKKPNTENEIVAACSLHPTDEFTLLLNFDTDTTPANTIISGRGTVDAIIDPQRFIPQNITAGIRYLILEDIGNATNQDGPDAWKNQNGSDFIAHANDIIEWSGTAWSVVFNSGEITDLSYITNSYTGVQYKWDGEQWSKSFEGIYDKEAWRLVL
jgi:hypothetical protein